MRGKLTKLYGEHGWLVAVWEEDGRTRRVKFLWFNRKEVIKILRTKYKVSVPHTFY